MQRLFFAIPIEEQLAKDINNWRSQQLAEQIFTTSYKAVPSKNFHITLAFLGMADKQQLAALIDGARKIHLQSFPLQLEHTGHFVKPKVAYLGVREVPVNLAVLAEQLKQLAINTGLPQQDRPYRPHLTLFRKAKQALPNVICQFAFEVKRFALFVSESTEQGVCYRELASWSLEQQ
jgi:2'-5' RNA ligase